MRPGKHHCRYFSSNTESSRILNENAPCLFSEQCLPNSEVTLSGNTFSDPCRGHYLAARSRNSTVSQSPIPICYESNFGNICEWTLWTSTADQAIQHRYSQHNFQSAQVEADQDVSHFVHRALANDDGMRHHHAGQTARAQSDTQSRSHPRVHRTARERVTISASENALHSTSAHALVERRYRQNIEARLQGLTNTYT